MRYLAGIALLLCGCSAPDPRVQIEKQLDLYANYMRTGNYFGVASLFAEDGVIEPAVRGKQAIQQHLTAKSTGLKVIDYQLDPASPIIEATTATQSVVFQQQLRTPQGNTVSITGTLSIRWVRTDAGRWLIGRLTTSSSPEQ